MPNITHIAPFNSLHQIIALFHAHLSSIRLASLTLSNSFKIIFLTKGIPTIATNKERIINLIASAMVILKSTSFISIAISSFYILRNGAFITAEISRSNINHSTHLSIVVVPKDFLYHSPSIVS